MSANRITAKKRASIHRKLDSIEQESKEILENLTGGAIHAHSSIPGLRDTQHIQRVEERLSIICLMRRVVDSYPD